MADDRFCITRAGRSDSRERARSKPWSRLARARGGEVPLRRLCSGLLLVGLCATAQGAFFSGRDLLTPLAGIRAGQPLSAGQMQALGYVQGVYDANAGLLFCSRKEVDAGQVVNAVNAYLLKHQGLLDQPASVGLTAAMIAQWPCRRRE